MYSSMIQEEKGRKIRIPPTYGNLMYSVTLSNPSAATLISRKLLDLSRPTGKLVQWIIFFPSMFILYFTFNFFFIPEVSCNFLYSFTSVLWTALFDFKIQFSSSALTASNLVQDGDISLCPWLLDWCLSPVKDNLNAHQARVIKQCPRRAATRKSSSLLQLKVSTLQG